MYIVRILTALDLCAHIITRYVLQAGVNDKVSHELAEKILIEMGEFFQIQVSHIIISIKNSAYYIYTYPQVSNIIMMYIFLSDHIIRCHPL